MSAWEEVHRGYGISYQGGDKIVRVRRPGERDPIEAAAYAEAGEERQDLRKKAKALIAADMTQLQRKTAEKIGPASGGGRQAS